MDSPRGRIYQMVQVANGAPVSESYQQHIDLCLACRACETACPSGVQYGRLVEAARAEIEARVPRPWTARLLRGFIFETLLPSRGWLAFAGRMLWLYQATGLQRLTRATGILKLSGGLAEAEALSPHAEPP
ncbi:MAG: 4Fe-4S dicluster domain-containing protein, partial [Bryobacteraceae bacterium]